MKRLPLLLVILFCAPLACYGQALVLTEIEQLQGKIWYLQQDVAAQKSSLDQLQKQLNQLTTRDDKEQSQQETRLTTLAQTVTGQQTGLTQMEGRLQKLEEMMADLAQAATSQQAGRTQLEDRLQKLVEMVEELTRTAGEQSSALRQQAEKTASLAGSMQGLNAEIAAVQTRNEQALTEMRDRLGESRAQIDALHDSRGDRIEQLMPWVVGVVLGLAVLLTIGLVAHGHKPKQRPQDQRPDHEL